MRIKIALISSLLIILGLTSCKVGRFVFYNFADIKDHKKFPSRIINAPAENFKFFSPEEGRYPRQIEYGGKEYSFDEYLEENKTVAFLIIKNDTIYFEEYFRKYDEESIVPSFSMAKSVLSILIGCAINDGYIRSVEEPVTNYVPELMGKGFSEVTLEHLLQMTSGVKFNESYSNPFGDAASYYYGRNLRKYISKMELENKPGEQFKYKSGSTQLLGLVLERALEDQSITDYLEEKIWIPLGMEFNASWSIDKKKDGLEKTFCCLNARARDFAKIGRLYLNGGNWKGEQIVPKTWVDRSTAVDTSAGSVWYYQYQWWLPTKSGDFIAEGILGQYIYVNPEKNMVIVRLGKKGGDTNWESVFTSLADLY